tara:strand:+ start:453 stop:641 length:189 start_codon:yes stop_codon:yes gene_type:complete
VAQPSINKFDYYYYVGEKWENLTRVNTNPTILKNIEEIPLILFVEATGKGPFVDIAISMRMY